MIWTMESFAASAASPFMDMLAQGLIPSACGGGPCQLCDLYQLAHNIIELLLQIAVPLAIAMLFYGGYLYIASGPDPAKRTQGTNAIKNAAIGLIIAFGAYAIITSALLIIGFKMPTSDAIKVWNEFPKCERYGNLTLVQQCGANGGALSGYCPGGQTCAINDSGFYACATTECSGNTLGSCAPGYQCVSLDGATYSCQPRIVDGGTSTLTEEEARAALGNIPINRTCDVAENYGTCVGNVKDSALQAIVDFKTRCSETMNTTCPVVITGGSEECGPGGCHAGDVNTPGSHPAGDKLDIDDGSQAINNYIENNFTRQSSCPNNGLASACYRDPQNPSHIYYREGNHWDICYVNCG